MKHYKINPIFAYLPLFASLLFSAYFANAQPSNIALDKPVTLSIPSTEPYTKDKNPARLTDGKYAGNEYDHANNTSTLWVQEGALTWKTRNDPIIITVDLGKTMPISGVSYNTAAGKAGVIWPSFIGIFVSDDAQTWHYAGDLAYLSLKNGVPNSDGYSIFRYVTHDLKTKGRYVALAAAQYPYTVTDEVEIYAGDNAWLKSPAPGRVFSALNTASVKTIISSGFAQRRILTDIQMIRQYIETSSLSAIAKSTFMAQLDRAAQENEAQETLANNIKTILPINDVHRDVMAIYGKILAAQNTPPLTVWKTHRYAWLPLLAKPDNNQKAVLEIDVLKNEIRSDSFLLTNASGQEKTVELKSDNPPSGAQTGWLQVNSVEWTDTYQGVPVADALLPVQNVQGRYKISIPAGFTRKVWITVDAAKLNPDDYKSTFSVAGQQIPFAISVSKTVMQHPRLPLTLFDNSDNKSLQGVASRGITAANKPAALAMMKSHFVDSPWADRNILPWPKAQDFDAQHQLTAMLDFSDLDEWLKEWPHARYYFVFINAKEKEQFAGTNRGTPEFNARLGAYAKVLSAHLQKVGLAPEQLAFLINDEPGIHGDWQDDVIADWARAIKNSGAKITLISDPTWKRPDLQKNQDAFTLVDIIMPNTQIYVTNPVEVKQFYENLRQQGKQLWLYACAGPVRLFNPQHYYRGQAWRVFEMGGTGMGFWAFNDIRTGKGMTSWNDYLSSTNFAPAFLDENTVYDSVHWSAVREGVEDFELLSQLQDAVAKTQNNTLRMQAQKVLSDAVQSVIATDTIDVWQKENQPELADQQLQNVRNLLEKFAD